jgi:transglutaminase-like putative cysteine protease
MVLLAIVAQAACAIGHAGDAPVWLHALAAAPLPAHEDKTPAVVLLAETLITVQPDGKVKRLYREATRILRPDGENRGLVRAYFDAQSRITNLRGWSIPVSGKDFEVKEKDAVESAVIGVDGSELVSDLRSKTLRIPAATVGSVIGYELEQELRPYVMADDWEFQDTVPVLDARYTVQLPKGWSYRANWLNHAEVEPLDAAGQARWSMHDIAAIRVEPDMPPWRGIAGRLVVGFVPPSGQDPGLRSWADLGTWYSGLAQGRRAASPEIKQKVGELTAGVDTKVGKIRALAAFVQNDIRYVAIELGIGGQQPHPAAETFRHRYGDCKDKVTLLGALLGEIGVESYYVIINTERGAVTAASPPDLDFNHAIIAIALPSDADVSALAARALHPKLGSILFFDPTDALTPFGALSGALQANYGMLVAPDGGELLALPQLPADSNGVTRTATMNLDDKGTLRGEIHEVLRGDHASSIRHVLRASTSDADRIRPVEAVAGAALSTFEISKATAAHLQENDRPFEWSYDLEAPNYAKRAGDVLLVRPRILGSRANGAYESKEERRYPIEFDGPERDTDSFEILLPPGYEPDALPPPVDVDDGFVVYHSRTEVVGRTLRYTRTFEVKGLSVPADKADKLKQLFRRIADDERNSAVLKRTGS